MRRPILAVGLSQLTPGKTRMQKVKDYEWVKVTLNAAFAPRDGAGALVFDGRMWLIGGWNPRKKNLPRICNNEVWSSADGVAWSLVKPNTFLDANFDATKDWEGRGEVTTATA